MTAANKRRIKILLRKRVEDRTGLSRSTIYLRIQKGSFPKPIPLGARAVGWMESEIDAWLMKQVEKRDADSGCAQ
jgi:prophage regulatory protein